jgi:acyl-CoA dehydrogenase
MTIASGRNTRDFDHSPKVKDLQERLNAFMDRFIYPAEAVYAQQMQDFGTNRWQVVPVLEDLKAKAKDAGLWNMFLPESHRGAGLSNLEYAPLCEIMGRVYWAPEVFNCSAPDTGNMEVLHRYGTREHKDEWLLPLMNGEIRSAFLMTEPDVASSDATNIQTSIIRDGDHYVINGRKWWSTGTGDPRCKIAIVMGKTDREADRHRQQSMILVPMDTPGVQIKRMLSVYGYDHAPHGHGEVILKDVRVPVTNMLLGEGRGFEIAQGRLGPGRLHHCMRTIGVAENAIEAMAKRLLSRVAFGKPIARLGKNTEVIAKARIELEAMRLMVLRAAKAMDTMGNAEARVWVSAVKAMVPIRVCAIIDEAIQVFGATGVSQWTPLSRMYASQRILRLADGPDEVHWHVVGRNEIARYEGEDNDTTRAARTQEGMFSGPA